MSVTARNLLASITAACPNYSTRFKARHLTVSGPSPNGVTDSLYGSEMSTEIGRCSEDGGSSIRLSAIHFSQSASYPASR